MSLWLVAHELVGAVRLSFCFDALSGAFWFRWEYMVLGWELAACAMHKGRMSPKFFKAKEHCEQDRDLIFGAKL